MLDIFEWLVKPKCCIYLCEKFIRRCSCADRNNDCCNHCIYHICSDQPLLWRFLIWRRMQNLRLEMQIAKAREIIDDAVRQAEAKKRSLSWKLRKSLSRTRMNLRKRLRNEGNGAELQRWETFFQRRGFRKRQMQLRSVKQGLGFTKNRAGSARRKLKALSKQRVQELEESQDLPRTSKIFVKNCWRRWCKKHDTEDD